MVDNGPYMLLGKALAKAKDPCGMSAEEFFNHSFKKTDR